MKFEEAIKTYLDQRSKEAIVEFVEPTYERPIVLPEKTAKKKANVLQLELF